MYIHNFRLAMVIYRLPIANSRYVAIQGYTPVGDQSDAIYQQNRCNGGVGVGCAAARR